jgi:hypothetical protein
MILQKTVNKFISDWPKNIIDALWAYRTASKNLMGMSPYKMVYGKAFHHPLELEHKAFWEIKQLNFDFKTTGEKRILDIHLQEEWRNEAYENSKMFKEKIKIWNEKRIQYREFKQGDQVLLFNSRFKFSAGKLIFRWSGPYKIQEVYRSGALRLKRDIKGIPHTINGQRLKHYLVGQKFVENVKEMSYTSLDE